MSRTRRTIKKHPYVNLNVNHLEDRSLPAPFTAGNLAVVRVGDGLAPLSSAAQKIFIDEYSTGGTLVQSIALPTAGATSLTMGSGTTEGHISRSLDGQYLVVAGYRADAGTPSVSGTSAATNPRVIGRLATDGTADTSTGLTDAYSNIAIRDVTTDNGTRFWTVGANAASGGLRYVSSLGATTSASISSSPNDNIRSVDVAGTLANPSLFISAGANTPGRTVMLVGTEGTLPTSGAQTYTATFPSVASGTTNDFFFADLSTTEPGLDTLYAVPVGTGAGNGLFKYTRTGGVWAQTGTAITPVSDNAHITGIISGSDVTLFVVNGTAVGNSIQTITDTSGYGGTLTGSLATIASAGANTSFRGLALAPAASSNVATTTAITSISPLSVNIGDNVTFQASVTAVSGVDTPVGTVEFRNGGTVLASGPVTGSGPTGTVTVNTTSVPNGTYNNITAVYLPSGAFNTSTSAVFGGTLTVNAIATTATLGSNNPNPSPGTNLTFTATITGSSTPTGTVDFFANGVKLNAASVNLNGSGQATINVDTDEIQALDGKTLTPGINDVSVVYNPTGIFLASSKAVPQKVQPNAFTVGNVLVYRTGDGINAMTANGNRFFIDEYLPGAGQTDPVQSIILPTIADGDNKPVLASGVQSRDAQVTTSPDGQYLYFTAYNALPTNATMLTFANGTTIPRVVGRLNLVTGAIDTSMALTDAASGGAVRSVAVASDNSIYVTGATGGIRYVPAYNAATTTSTGLGGTTSSWTSVNIFGNPAQLYASALPSSPPAAPKVASVGTGLPTSGTPTITDFPGLPLDNATAPKYPTDFFLADLSGAVAADASGVDTLYVVEDGNFTGGTITKWSWDATGLTWISNGSVSPPPGGIPGVSDSFSGLSGTVSGGNVSLFTTIGAGGSNNNGGGTLWSLSDTAGYNAAFSTTTVTQVAQVGLGSNKAFRGLAIVPTAAPVAPVVSSIVVNNGVAQRSKITTVQVNFAAPVNAANFQSPTAVTFTRTGIPTNNIGTIGTVVDTSNGLLVAPASGMASSITLTFDNVLNAGVENGSLADGRWQLAIPSASYLSPNNPGDIQLRRLFGNENNDTTTDANDLGFFPPFGSISGSIFDWDNNNFIDAADLSEFGNRFGITLV